MIPELLDQKHKKSRAALEVALLRMVLNAWCLLNEVQEGRSLIQFSKCHHFASQLISLE